MPPSSRYAPVRRYLALGDGFADPVSAAPFPRHALRFRNQPAARTVGLDTLMPAEWEAHFARFEPLPANLPHPLALRYHGHQFGSYNPQLGDGRGFLFAQLRENPGGRLLDLGTKGSGRTPWSRGGDGKLTLKGGVREVLATEMLESLGVDTSRTFSLFETGEELFRGDEPSPTRSSVLVRLSHSHVRIGTFQRFAYHDDSRRITALIEYVVETYMPEVASSPGSLPVAFVREVARRLARTCAQWMVAGFVHGVLNTDNMNVTGESFDYGPFRFLPTYDPRFTAAYFDHSGMYAFGQQPQAVWWNLSQLARALGSVADARDLIGAADTFKEVLVEHVRAGVCERLGIALCGDQRDDELVDTIYTFLATSQIGYDRFFFDWYGGSSSDARASRSPHAAAYSGDGFASVRALLADRVPSHPERLADPYFAREAPCSMLIEEIEALWSAIDTDDDWGPLDRKIEDVRAMGRVYGRRANTVTEDVPSMP